MSTATRRPRWSYRRWLERLDATDITGPARDLARLFLRLARDSGKARRWVAAWEIDWHDEREAAFPGPDVMAVMRRLEDWGLAARYFAGADFLPTLRDLPAPGSVRLTRAERALVRRLLRLDGWDRGLWYLVRHGYCTPRDTPLTWRWCWYKYGCVPPAPLRNTEALDRLGSLGLIEPSGCILGGWRDPDLREYRLYRRRLVCLAHKDLARYAEEAR